MELKLKILGGRNAGHEIDVPGPTFLIGRADECQLRPKSDYVSRRHASLEVDESKVLISDLGSRTGTFVNGHLIPPKRSLELANGDTVKIGPIEFGVVIKFSVSGKKKPKVVSIEDAASRTAASAADGDVDVTQWLQPTDEDVSLGATIDVGPGGMLMSAADLLGMNSLDAQAAAEAEAAKKKTGDEPPPDKAASDMLRNYLRRR